MQQILHFDQTEFHSFETYVVLKAMCCLVQ